MAANALRSIKDGLAAGAIPKKDDGLRGQMFHFIEQMKRELGK